MAGANVRVRIRRGIVQIHVGKAQQGRVVPIATDKRQGAPYIRIEKPGSFYAAWLCLLFMVPPTVPGLAAPYPCWRLCRRLFARKAGAKVRVRIRRGNAQIHAGKAQQGRVVPTATDKRVIYLAVIKP